MQLAAADRLVLASHLRMALPFSFWLLIVPLIPNPYNTPPRKEPVDGPIDVVFFPPSSTLFPSFEAFFRGARRVMS